MPRSKLRRKKRFSRLFFSCLSLSVILVLPVGHAGFVEGHEVNLARGTTLGGRKENFVVPLTQEL